MALGFTDKAQVPFGFGYLAPERENRFAMGALFSTHMFPGRAPQGSVLMEALVGGRRHPERLELSDEELISRIYDDLRQLIPLPEPPCFSRVLRGDGSIPQLEMGYPALLSWKDSLEQTPGRPAYLRLWLGRHRHERHDEDGQDGGRQNTAPGGRNEANARGQAGLFLEAVSNGKK